MMLALEDILSIARDHGYEEIELNETSKMISFRGGPANSTRVNVYYTTGTVGTCLNHPKRGKTQLFRRNVTTLDMLNAIFEDPRLHTGTGYYQRQNIRQQWKKNGENDLFLRDSARRWIYVANAVGMVKNAREMKTIIDICTEWDDLYWGPEDEPNLFNVFYGCGSHGRLLKMLYEVVKTTCGDFETCNRRQAEQYLEGEINRWGVKTEVPYKEDCMNRASFLEEHAEDVRKIQNKFLSLRKNIRIELAQWFLSRDVAGCVFTDCDFQPFETKYSWKTEAAHVEYGELVYPKKAGLCKHCGVLYTEDRE